VYAKRIARERRLQQEADFENATLIQLAERERAQSRKSFKVPATFEDDFLMDDWEDELGDVESELGMRDEEDTSFTSGSGPSDYRGFSLFGNVPKSAGLTYGKRKIVNDDGMTVVDLHAKAALARPVVGKQVDTNKKPKNAVGKHEPLKPLKGMVEEKAEDKKRIRHHHKHSHHRKEEESPTKGQRVSFDFGDDETFGKSLDGPSDNQSSVIADNEKSSSVTDGFQEEGVQKEISESENEQSVTKDESDGFEQDTLTDKEKPGDQDDFVSDDGHEEKESLDNKSEKESEASDKKELDDEDDFENDDEDEGGDEPAAKEKIDDEDSVEEDEGDEDENVSKQEAHSEKGDDLLALDNDGFEDDGDDKEDQESAKEEEEEEEAGEGNFKMVIQSEAKDSAGDDEALIDFDPFDAFTL
jgi:hypothetical protein